MTAPKRQIFPYSLTRERDVPPACAEASAGREVVYFGFGTRQEKRQDTQ